MGLLKTAAYISGVAIVAWRLGFVDLPNLFNISLFGQKADFQIRRIHSLRFSGGTGTQLSMSLDFLVINKSNATITAKKLLLHVYDDQGKWIGSSEPYNYPVIINPNSTVVVPNVIVIADMSRLIFDIGTPLLIQYLQNGGQNSEKGRKIGKKLVIYLSVELNGIMVNQKIDYEF